MKTLAAIVRPSGPCGCLSALLSHPKPEHEVAHTSPQEYRASATCSLQCGRLVTNVSAVAQARLENVLRGPSGDAVAIFTHPLARVWASGLRHGHVPCDVSQKGPSSRVKLAKHPRPVFRKDR